MNKNLSAKKSLGQNFIKSKKAINQMIDAANLVKEDIVIEIGPGKGVLTKAILETGAKVIAFELDKRMVDFLEIEFSTFIKSGQLKIIHEDILNIDVVSFLNEDSNFNIKNSYKLIANIPYYITNAIIRKFLESELQPTDMILLVQKEVAERIVVRDGKQSLLSLSIAAFGDVKYISKVDKKYFSPIPKVNSAIIHIFNISREKIGAKEREDLFFKMIHLAFSHKRKKCIKNLQNMINRDVLIDIFSDLKIDKNVRAEELDIGIWINFLNKYLSKICFPMS